MASMVAWFTHLVVTNVDTVAAGVMGGQFAGMGGMVERSGLLIALYDGTPGGGTCNTLLPSAPSGPAPAGDGA